VLPYKHTTNNITKRCELPALIHREHRGVGAQSTLRGHKTFPGKICIKNQQNAQILHDSCRKNYQNTRLFMIFARKIYKIHEFYLIFAPEMPEFYIIIARKNMRATLMMENYFSGHLQHRSSRSCIHQHHNQHHFLITDSSVATSESAQCLCNSL